MFLIDTDVLSALRRRERSPDVVRWISDQRTTDLYLSVVSVGEIERGIVRQRHRDPAFARVLAAWLDSALALYGERISPDKGVQDHCGLCARWTSPRNRIRSARGHAWPPAIIRSR